MLLSYEFYFYNDNISKYEKVSHHNNLKTKHNGHYPVKVAFLTTMFQR